MRNAEFLNSRVNAKAMEWPDADGGIYTDVVTHIDVSELPYRFLHMYRDADLY